MSTPLWAGGEGCASSLQGQHGFTALELFGHLKTFATKTGAYGRRLFGHLNVDSAIGLGCVLTKRYACPKVPGRIAKCMVQVAVPP